MCTLAPAPARPRSAPLHAWGYRPPVEAHASTFRASSQALAAHLAADGALTRMLAKRLLPELQQLRVSGAEPAGESKFTGMTELSYASLREFYGGLEGRVGAPMANVMQAMEAEHLRGCECDVEFTTGHDLG